MPGSLREFSSRERYVSARVEECMKVGFHKLGVSHTLGRETADDLGKLIRRRLAGNFSKELSNAFSIWLVLRLISCGTTRVDYRRSCEQKQRCDHICCCFHSHEFRSSNDDVQGMTLSWGPLTSFVIDDVLSPDDVPSRGP